MDAHGQAGPADGPRRKRLAREVRWEDAVGVLGLPMMLAGVLALVVVAGTGGPVAGVAHRGADHLPTLPHTCTRALRRIEPHFGSFSGCCGMLKIPASSP